jgi:hypothetical protein
MSFLNSISQNGEDNVEESTNKIIGIHDSCGDDVSPYAALAQKTSPVAPTRAQAEAVVREAFEKFQSDTSGKNADYIPFLAQVDSKMFGVAIVTVDNQVLSMGEIKYAFSIQSISKVYTLALAMNELGAARVFRSRRQRTDRSSLQLAGRRRRHAYAYRESTGQRRSDRHDKSHHRRKRG